MHSFTFDIDLTMAQPNKEYFYDIDEKGCPFST